MKEYCSDDPKMEKQECAVILLEQKNEFSKTKD